MEKIKCNAFEKKALATRPKHVAIVGMGATGFHFSRAMQATKGIRNFPDEVWGVTFAAHWLRCQKAFFMDGLDYLKELGWESWYEIAKNMQDTAIMVPQKSPDIKCTVEYPINEVISKLGVWREFANSGCYAIAYAIAIGVKRIDLFGFDFHYPVEMGIGADGTPVELYQVGEIGMAATEFWAGIAVGSGIQVFVPDQSRFMNFRHPEWGRFYGYPKGTVKVSLTNSEGTVYALDEEENMRLVKFGENDKPKGTELQDLIDKEQASAPKD